MKKFIILLACIFSFQLVMADNDKPVTIEQLPAKAQNFIKQNFPDSKVAFAKKEKEWRDISYDVVFINGNKLEFDKNGEWTELKCKRTGVPEKAVPVQIVKFVKENYPDAQILKVEKDRYEYEVKLSNFWEVTFDLKFNVIDLDRDDD